MHCHRNSREVCGAPGEDGIDAQTRNLKLVQPDARAFPSWDQGLATAMQRETEMLFETIMHEDRTVLDFIGADYTFVNERLARHYGIRGVEGPL